MSISLWNDSPCKSRYSSGATDDDRNSITLNVREACTVFASSRRSAKLSRKTRFEWLKSTLLAVFMQK